MAVERFLPSAIAHFEPADLIGALSTGIVVLDCRSVRGLRERRRAGPARRQRQPGARQTLPVAGARGGLAAAGLMRRALDTGETLSERELSVMTGPLGRERRVIDVTMTPLDSEFERKYLLLEISDATQRQRITRENELMARLDSSRQMVRQLAHEIKNPLGGLRGAAQLLERELHEHLREYTGVIISEADRLTALVDSMIGPARAPQKALINVHELCEHVYPPAAQRGARRRAGRARLRSVAAECGGRRQPDHPGAAQHRAQRAAGRRGARPHRDSHARRRERQHRHDAAQARGEPVRSRTTARACRPRSPTRSSSRWSPAARTARAWVSRSRRTS